MTKFRKGDTIRGIRLEHYKYVASVMEWGYYLYTHTDRKHPNKYNSAYIDDYYELITDIFREEEDHE